MASMRDIKPEQYSEYPADHEGDEAGLDGKAAKGPCRR